MDKYKSKKKEKKEKCNCCRIKLYKIIVTKENTIALLW